MRELQAIAFRMAFQGDIVSLSSLPGFVVKTESECTPIPHSFVVQSLPQFVWDLPEDRFLCPVHAVRICLALTSSISLLPRSLFVSPWRSPRTLSKTSLSFFLRRVIIDADTLYEGTPPRAHSIQGVAMSAAFVRARSVSKVLGAATWRSNLVFASFSFKYLSYSLLLLTLFLLSLFYLLFISSYPFLFTLRLWSFSMPVGAVFPHRVSFVCLRPAVTWTWVLT